MKLLVTGGAGFIGSHFIRYWLENYSQDFVVNFDLLTYAGNLENLSDVVNKFGNRYIFIKGNITNYSEAELAFVEHKPDIVVNFAAESHNSWAIIDPGKFFRTNVLGTQVLLEVARKKGIERFQHISTCEVYGDLPLDSNKIFAEQSPCRPRTPYNASKAGADHVVQSYCHTFDIPAVISRCSNNYGSFQFPEKVIPLFTTKALQNERMPLYKHSQNKREWIHVIDHCRAIDLMIKHGKNGEIYNVGTGTEKTVEEIADFILDVLNLPQSMKIYIPDRPSHDKRYLLDSSKIRKLGWESKTKFDDGLTETIQWYVENEKWWQKLEERNVIHEDGWSK